MDVTFKRFVGNIRTVVTNFSLFRTETIEYLSIHSFNPALPGTSQNAQALHSPLPKGGDWTRVTVYG